MTHELRAAHTIPAAQLHQALITAFADYLAGPIKLPFVRWPQFLGRQVVDLSLSRVAMVDHAVAAFALVSQRANGLRWRLAAMGAVPAARGSGAAQTLLDDWIERAETAEVRHLELEAFAQNERALRLYRSRGFAVRHDLQGYAGTIPDGPPPPDQALVSEVDSSSAFAWLDHFDCCTDDVPLQVLAASLTAVSDPIRAWRLGMAQLVASVNEQGTVTIHSLLDMNPEQRNAETLVRRLWREYSGRPVIVPPMQRQDLGGLALQRAGLSVQPLHQVLLSMTVGACPSPEPSRPRDWPVQPQRHSS